MLWKPWTFTFRFLFRSLDFGWLYEHHRMSALENTSLHTFVRNQGQCFKVMYQIVQGWSVFIIHFARAVSKSWQDHKKKEDENKKAFCPFFLSVVKFIITSRQYLLSSDLYWLGTISFLFKGFMLWSFVQFCSNQRSAVLWAGQGSVKFMPFCSCFWWLFSKYIYRQTTEYLQRREKLVVASLCLSKLILI